MKIKKKRSKRSIALSKCFALHSKLVRWRAEWKCEKCGTAYEIGSGSLHCSHVIPGRNSIAHIAFLPDNGFSLCYRCHYHWWHANPIEAAEWAEAKLGKDVLEALILEGHTPRKVSLDEILTIEENLRGSLRAMEEERLENNRRGRIEFDSPYPVVR